MAWQETPFPPNTYLDADAERELRLVAQARSGADWALAALIARYQPAVVRYLVRLTGDNVQARALAERIFRRMDHRIRGPRGGEYLRLWLLRACTEAGLDVLRHPTRVSQRPMVGPANPAGLLAERVTTAAQGLREGFERIAEATDLTRRQVAQLIWQTAPQAALPPRRERRASQPFSRPRVAEPSPVDPELDALDPREELRHRIIRAVLAELPYGDAQCLALHLIAGLNQAEVARALGIRPSAARHRIVLGLERFAQRYESALDELGVSKDFGYSASGRLSGHAAAVAELDAAPTEPLEVPVGAATEQVEVADGVLTTLTTPVPVIPVRLSGDKPEDPRAIPLTPAPATRPLPPYAPDELPVRVIDAPPSGPIIDAVASPVVVVEHQAPSDEHDLALEPMPDAWEPNAQSATGTHLAGEHMSTNITSNKAPFVLSDAPAAAHKRATDENVTPAAFVSPATTPAVVPVRSHLAAQSPNGATPTREVPVRSPGRPRHG